ncbi:MAG: DUF262 domain-containing protein [Gaiellaceae bacterium]
MTLADIEHEQKLVNAFIEAQQAAVLETADQGLATLASLVSSGAIDVSPTFQRRDRWTAEQQSLLIESFLANIPVPPVYLAEDIASLGSYAVIDGKQRLTSISEFFSDNLVLRGVTRLTDLNGLRYSSLPEGIRTPLGMKGLRVTTLLRQSSEELKHEVFLRLNTGGEILNAQEIRNVAYRGPLNDLVMVLAENRFLRSQFKVVPPSSPAYRQMTDAEYVLRFFTLSSIWEGFKGDLRTELDRFMWERRFSDASFLGTLERRFATSIETAEAVWGRDAFKRPGRDQALAGLYDAQMIALSELPADAHRTLVQRRQQVLETTRGLFDGDPEFDESVRRATNTPARLRYRTETMLSVLREIAEQG